MGPIRMAMVRNRTIQSLVDRGYDRRDARQMVKGVGDKALMGCVLMVAELKQATSLFVGPSEERPILDKIVQFFIDNWEEILKLILMLFGIAI